MDIKIISPTYKRAGRVKATDVFHDRLILAVHEFEVEEYKKSYPNNEIMVLPDDIKGNMAKVRNYIRDNANSRYLVMVDDDVREMGYRENLDPHPIGFMAIMQFIENGFQMAEDLGTVLWGVNVNEARQFYREYSPFSFLSPVLGTFCCHIIDDNALNDIRYDERLGLNEDYDFALQVLHKHHKILRNNKYYYVASHLTVSGGCGSYRVLDTERKQAEIMIKKWGSDVVSYNFEESTNPIVKAPLKGI